MVRRLPKGVIFDLDGTLVDSGGDVAAILNQILEGEDLTPFSNSEVKAFMGDGIRATIEKALTSRGCDAQADKVNILCGLFMNLYVANLVVTTKPYPHAAVLLAWLAGKGVVIGVCTNKSEEPARLVLERTGLQRHVSVLVGSDSGFGQKPEAGPLRACAHKLGVPLSQVIYVGDHAVDVATARAAGVSVIIARYGYGVAVGELPGVDRTIGCLSELPAILSAFA